MAAAAAARAVRDAAKEDFLDAFAAVAGAVKELFPRNRPTQEVFFDQFRSRGASVDDEPRAASDLTANTPIASASSGAETPDRNQERSRRTAVRRPFFMLTASSWSLRLTQMSSLPRCCQLIGIDVLRRPLAAAHAAGVGPAFAPSTWLS
jgi:hypothetical protein